MNTVKDFNYYLPRRNKWQKVTYGWFSFNRRNGKPCKMVHKETKKEHWFNFKSESEIDFTKLATIEYQVRDADGYWNYRGSRAFSCALHAGRACRKKRVGTTTWEEFNLDHHKPSYMRDWDFYVTRRGKPKPITRTYFSLLRRHGKPCYRVNKYTGEENHF